MREPCLLCGFLRCLLRLSGRPLSQGLSCTSSRVGCLRVVRLLLFCMRLLSTRDFSCWSRFFANAFDPLGLQLLSCYGVGRCGDSPPHFYQLGKAAGGLHQRTDTIDIYDVWTLHLLRLGMRLYPRSRVLCRQSAIPYAAVSAGLRAVKALWVVSSREARLLSLASPR